MAITMVMASSFVAIGFNSSTGERGFLTLENNNSGSAISKGTVVSVDSANDDSIVPQDNEYDAIGVAAEDIANGASGWVWKNGSVCQVLYTSAPTRGYVAICSPTDGYATAVAVPKSNPVVAEHFKEIGHVKGPTSGDLTLTELHFN